MKALWIRNTLCFVAIASLVIAAEIVWSECNPDYTGGSITVTSGTLNSQVLNTANPRVAVAPGSALTGSVDIHVVNNGGGGDVFPVCATTSWGDHASSGWTIDTWLHNPPGAADYAVPINLTAPVTPGTYYIFFAASWEMNCGNVLSCTNWNNGTGDLWDDGYDVADWTGDQAQSAIDLGWVCTDWMKNSALTQFDIPAAAIIVTVLADNCDPGYTAGSIAVTSGTLNGIVLNSSDPLVAVEPGGALTGTVDIHVVNNGGGGDVFPVCATTSWGDHASSGWTIDTWLHNPPGAADYAISIDLTAPVAPGTHYIFFAASWEMNCGNVLSCTNWNNGTGDLWNNGYDVADWTGDQAQSAIDLGWVCTDWMKNGVLTQFNVPAGAIRVLVDPVMPVRSTTWGGIKALYQ